MIPDAEKTISSYLRDHPDVSALSTRIVGKTPPATAEPWVRVTELDAPAAAASRADHLISFLVQLDVYAGATGGQPEAKTHARTIRAALHAMPGVHDETVVTQVRVIGWLRAPDPDFEPARDRVIITASVIAHEAPA